MGRSLSMIIFGFILAMVPVSHAGLLIEPYLNYELIGQVANVNASGDVSAKTSGLGMGGRIGYSLPILFWAALDYSMLPTGTAKPDVIGSSYSTSRSDLYLTAGIDLPILLRVWLGYGLMNSLTLKKPGGDETYSGGTNFKIGVGFKLIPLVTLFAEAYTHKSSKVNVGGNTVDVSSYVVGNYVDAGGVVGVSVPFDL
ncbi:MAG: hypothetical protein C5B49_16025 [Bdellovibrio sp.]|nr:MAG: hypothetical protein C5B49_16025 [Bdellovibrio sp.]